MLQSSGVKQPHDPGDWASYLLARRRCTSPAPPREPDRAGGTLRRHTSSAEPHRIKAEAVGPEDPR
jgi:hypothetical protein